MGQSPPDPTGSFVLSRTSPDHLGSVAVNRVIAASVCWREAFLAGSMVSGSVHPALSHEVVHHRGHSIEVAQPRPMTR